MRESCYILAGGQAGEVSDRVSDVGHRAQRSSQITSVSTRRPGLCLGALGAGCRRVQIDRWGRLMIARRVDQREKERKKTRDSCHTCEGVML